MITTDCCLVSTHVTSHHLSLPGSECHRRHRGAAAEISMLFAFCCGVGCYALCILKNFITDCTSQSAGLGIRASIFNRCNSATVRIREVPIVHASYYVHAAASSNKWFIVCADSPEHCKLNALWDEHELGSGFPLQVCFQAWYMSYFIASELSGYTIGLKSTKIIMENVTRKN